MSLSEIPSIHSVVSTRRAVRDQSIFGHAETLVVLDVGGHFGDRRGFHAQVHLEPDRAGERRHRFDRAQAPRRLVPALDQASGERRSFRDRWRTRFSMPGRRIFTATSRALARVRPVHLGDRGRRHRRAEFGEQGHRFRPERSLKLRLRLVLGKRWQAVLQSREVRARSWPTRSARVARNCPSLMKLGPSRDSAAAIEASPAEGCARLPSFATHTSARTAGGRSPCRSAGSSASWASSVRPARASLAKCLRRRRIQPRLRPGRSPADKCVSRNMLCRLRAIDYVRQPQWMATMPPVRLRNDTRENPAAATIAASASGSGNLRMLSTR